LINLNVIVFIVTLVDVVAFITEICFVFILLFCIFILINTHEVTNTLQFKKKKKINSKEFISFLINFLFNYFLFEYYRILYENEKKIAIKLYNRNKSKGRSALNYDLSHLFEQKINIVL
jgi:hypothetical protein